MDDNKQEHAKEAASLTISTFCKRNELSRSKFYALVKQGLGPTMMDLSGMKRISIDAERRWQRACEERVATK